MTWQIVVLAAALGSGSMLGAGVPEIRKEADPVKRFELALSWAETQTKAARQLVKDSGSRNELAAMLEEIQAATELSLESLRETGKRPNKMANQYKKGELKTMEILRNLKDLVVALSLDDRPGAEKVRDSVEVTHEEFLLGVMSRK